MLSTGDRVDRRVLALTIGAATWLLADLFTTATIAIPVAFAALALVLIWDRLAVEPTKWMIRLAKACLIKLRRGGDSADTV